MYIGQKIARTVLFPAQSVYMEGQETYFKGMLVVKRCQIIHVHFGLTEMLALFILMSSIAGLKIPFD